ncbi:carbamoyl phosphate synthase large subunit [Sulfolobales archaeon HS-7]|nr:carbamoyl phosphate synthase large subunit [Sulfolobales archaeon HS-7]
MKKILVIGSGAIKIAEAAEFDYSATQALKAIKEEGIQTVLFNPNVATVQTSYTFADKVYMLPLNVEFVSRIIEKERPDGIMIGFGGQSALNIGIDLYKKGVLNNYSVKVLGTPISGIERALSRERFRETMIERKLPVPPSYSARDYNEAIEKAEMLGYPLMIRVSFNLGGRGSSVIWNENQLRKEIPRALSQSYINEVLLEKYLHHWKELEYEVIRDSDGNSSVVACIENLDPMGTHTGESVVVTPCQTLDNTEYQKMRDVAIKVAESIELQGECNVQFALSPEGSNFYVIETNPRMSRSSALASKATGYPLAYVSAKIALGYKLYEIRNSVSGSTCACFEPSLDYIVIKSPRWDLDKFDKVETSLGTEMKSVGEVMAIGRNFEEALQKATRMLDIGVKGVFDLNFIKSMNKEKAIKYLSEKRPYWFLSASAAFYYDADTEEVYQVTGIDKFFLDKIRGLVAFAKQLNANPEKDMLINALKLGFSQEQLEEITGLNRQKIQELTENHEPVVKQIDTVAGEWPAQTNYLYLTYNGSENDITFDNNGVLLVGAGGFRIGVSVEFDWGLISALSALSRYIKNVTVLNYNPETVSTDWDIAKKLYFDEISSSVIMSVLKKEKYKSVAIFSAGQIGNNLAKELESNNISLLGTAGSCIDKAENRAKFSELLNKLGIPQPEWTSVTTSQEIKSFIEKYGFPVIIRPSYVLSGSNMVIIENYADLNKYLSRSRVISTKYPAVISKFFKGATEAELDCAGDGNTAICIPIEHIEEAGIHSGDATIVTPPITLKENTLSTMLSQAELLVRELNIRGPFNIQYLIKEKPHVLELNLRTSRSMPFSSKAVGTNVVDLGVRGIFEGFHSSSQVLLNSVSWAVKSPQFSWAQLKGAYPYLGPEMRSTGEVASLGYTYQEALIKSWLSASPNNIPSHDKLILIYGDSNRDILIKVASNFTEKGFTVITYDKMPLPNYNELDHKRLLFYLSSRKIGLVVTDGYAINKDYEIRRSSVDFNIPLILNAKLGFEISYALFNVEIFSYNELKEYWLAEYSG